MKSLKRVIVDFKKLTPEVLKLLVETYPDGYDDRNIISFKNAKGERVEAVEVLAGDTKYLVKVSAKLEYTMEHHDAENYDFDDNSEAVPKPDLTEEEEDI